MRKQEFKESGSYKKEGHLNRLSHLGLFLIVCVLIAGMIFGLMLLLRIGVLLFGASNQITIEKETCINKSYWHMYDNFIQIKNNVSYPLTPNEKIECSENTCHIFYKDFEEVCSKELVENIMYYSTETICTEWADRKDVSDEEYLHNGIPCTKWIFTYPRITLMKAGITTQWRDENCMCNGCADTDKGCPGHSICVGGIGCECITECNNWICQFGEDKYFVRIE